MCGIAGIVSLDGGPILDLQRRLNKMNDLIRHGGPDGEGYWIHPDGRAGFAHRRLSIIDLETGAQPMRNEGRPDMDRFLRRDVQPPGRS